MPDHPVSGFNLTFTATGVVGEASEESNTLHTEDTE